MDSKPGCDNEVIKVTTLHGGGEREADWGDWMAPSGSALTSW